MKITKISQNINIGTGVSWDVGARKAYGVILSGGVGFGRVKYFNPVSQMVTERDLKRDDIPMLKIHPNFIPDSQTLASLSVGTRVFIPRYPQNENPFIISEQDNKKFLMAGTNRKFMEDVFDRSSNRSFIKGDFPWMTVI